jgi:hypothetical protein
MTGPDVRGPRAPRNLAVRDFGTAGYLKDVTDDGWRSFSFPPERALKVLAGRRKAILRYYLFQGPKRLSELRRLAPSASQEDPGAPASRGGGARDRAPRSLPPGAAARRVHGDAARPKPGAGPSLPVRLGRRHAAARWTRSTAWSASKLVSNRRAVFIASGLVAQLVAARFRQPR